MSASKSAPAGNPFLCDPIPATFIRTALPIVLLASINGLLTVVDAIFLGAFVGADALAAVTMVFPISMLMAALATMISTGMASILARLLGAGKLGEARQVFAGAHGLSMAISIGLMALFAAFGWPLVTEVVGGAPHIAAMGHAFLTISVFTLPLMVLLSVHSDALRTEGRIGFMAIAGLLVSFANMAFNYAFIVWFGLGVAGSAMGTALAQALALVVVIAFRVAGRAQLKLSLTDLAQWRFGWGEILALGVPRSLSFIGIALGAGATILSLRVFGPADIEASIAAYGVITRIMTFAFLPMLGMALAMQAIVGNNFGAGQFARSDATLKLALVVSLIYAALVEVGLLVFRDQLGSIFVDDPKVSAELAEIIPVYIACYFTAGPMMMIANYFQSVGDVRRSALLSLARTYLFAVPLTFVLPMIWGVGGIWFALPIADALLVTVTAVLLIGRSKDLKWGLFKAA